MVETKGFDSQDGIALQWMQWKGLKTGVISGRESLGTAERARQLKMNYVYQGHIEKIPILEEIMAEAAISQPEEVAYMGDDLTDLVVMRRVGFAIAVANARPEVKREAHYVTEAAGGNGAVREVIEIDSRCRGLLGGDSGKVRSPAISQPLANDSRDSGPDVKMREQIAQATTVYSVSSTRRNGGRFFAAWITCKLLSQLTRHPSSVGRAADS